MPLLLASFIILSGCWQDVLLSSPGLEDGGEDAVVFGTYVGRDAVTRAVTVDRDNIGEYGFGVNAWYSGLMQFDDYLNISPEPDFMKNTRVYNDGFGWMYSPLKYWPNNPDELVSFVAYAPYNIITDDQGNAMHNENISVKSTMLTYKVANDVKDQVDLLWSDSSVSEEYNTIDMKKPFVDTKVSFYFRHALSKITFTVEAAVDEVAAGDNLLDENTCIFVRRVVLMGADDIYTETEGWLTAGGPFYNSGVLDLLSGMWSEKTLGQRFEFITEHFVGEKDLELNSTNSATPQRLLNDDSDLMVIPNDSDGETSFKVYIEYDVVTTDTNLDDGVDDGNTITNRIVSDDAVNMDFMSGKTYNLNLILGMTSAKLDLDVYDWVNEDSDNTAATEDADLPENAES